MSFYVTCITIIDTIILKNYTNDANTPILFKGDGRYAEAEGKEAEADADAEKFTSQGKYAADDIETEAEADDAEDAEVCNMYIHYIIIDIITQTNYTIEA
jgi:hypothetical protein